MLSLSYEKKSTKTSSNRQNFAIYKEVGVKKSNAGVRIFTVSS